VLLGAALHTSILSMALQSLRLAAKAVPTSRAFKECSYRFLTVPVDEFRTTNICTQSGANKGHWRDSPGLAMV
jgi:hypothetical protein